MQKPIQEKTPKIIAESPKSRYVCYNDVIGRGAYKIVYRAYDKHNGIEVAWSMIRLGGLKESEITLIMKELKMLKDLSPQNEYIINFHNAWLDDDGTNIVIITELAMSGTLKDYILKINDKINMRVIKKWCYQILEGISFLHDQHIAHRDLKCNNIFYNSNTGKIILGDFGLAKHKQTQFHSIIGTPEYMAPEMYDGVYDEKIDIYAFGMCFLEMITKKIPYGDCGGVGTVFKKVTDGIKPEILNTVKNEKAKILIERCISINPCDRPTAKDLLIDPFFNVITQEDNEDDLVEEEIKDEKDYDVLVGLTENLSLSGTTSPLTFLSDNDSDELILQPFEETEEIDEIEPK